MIEGKNKVLQAFLGTLMTWGLTAAGSALVFLFSTGIFSGKRKVLDASLGFAAGVMTAASFWSLLGPAIEKAEKLGTYGNFAFAPVAIGFILGGLFVLLSDWCIPHIAGEDPAITLAMHTTSHKNVKNENAVLEELSETVCERYESNSELDVEAMSDCNSAVDNKVNAVKLDDIVSDEIGVKVRQRKNKSEAPRAAEVVLQYEISKTDDHKNKIEKYQSWKRILLLIIAITVHNIPEGLAVGVSFGAIGTTEGATFQSARNLAVGIGIQNFPEGMAVSVPLCAAGYSPLKSFWYGQLSGMVEPVFGVLGALLVIIADPLLPYALAFAAGAMIYVVVDDIIPEASICGNGRIASWGCMVGFTVMMCLDVGIKVDEFVKWKSVFRYLFGLVNLMYLFGVMFYVYSVLSLFVRGHVLIHF